MLDEAIEQSRHQPVPASPGVKLSLAYLFALSDGERRSFDGFLEFIASPARSEEPSWSAAYRRSTYAWGVFEGIVRSIGFFPSVAVEHVIANARRDGKIAEHEREFWREVDDQVISNVRVPRRGCDWLVPRDRKSVQQAGTAIPPSPGGIGETGG